MRINKIRKQKDSIDSNIIFIRIFQPLSLVVFNVDPVQYTNPYKWRK